MKLSSYIIDRKGDLPEVDQDPNQSWPSTLIGKEHLIHYSPNSIDLELSVEQSYDDSDEDNPVATWLVSGDLDFSSATRFWYFDVSDKKFGVIAASLEVEEFEDVDILNLIAEYSKLMQSEGPNATPNGIWDIIKEGIWPDADSDDRDLVTLTLEIENEGGDTLLDSKTYSDAGLIEFIIGLNELGRI